MITENEFINRLKNLPAAIPSITEKAHYTAFKIENDTLYFQRVIPKTNWNLNVKELYQIYKRNDFINTSVIKKETGGRVHSPSVAILIAIGCIDNKRNRINKV